MSREAFEQVYKNRNLTKVADGWGGEEYEDSRVQNLWQGWQACAEQKDKRIAELQRALKDERESGNDYAKLFVEKVRLIKELVEALEAISGATQLTNKSWTKKKLLTLIRDYANEALAKVKGE